MCDVAADIKRPLYQLVAQDSRNAQQVGQAIGGKFGQTIEDEGKYNTQNPGHAVTKAAETFASMYAGGLLGGAAGAGGAAATDAAESGGTLALNAAGNAVTPYAAAAAEGGAAGALGQAAGTTADAALKQEIQREAIASALKTSPQGGLLSSAYHAMVPGVGPQQADMLASQTGDFGAAGLGRTMQAAAGAQGVNPVTSFAANAGGGLLSGAGGGKAQDLALQMGLKSMQQQPQQRPMQAQGRPAPQQGGPLPTPYGSKPMGPSDGLPLSLTELQKQRLRQLGYQV